MLTYFAMRRSIKEQGNTYVFLNHQQGLASVSNHQKSSSAIIVNDFVKLRTGINLSKAQEYLPH